MAQPKLQYRAADAQPHVRWNALSADPNSSTVVERRAHVLAAAWRPRVDDRTRFIADRARGRRVLDIGCVAHDDARMASEDWLHRHIVDAASNCLGVDVLPEGVDAMVEAGYNAVTVDLSDNPNALAGEPLFQLIVAGELIEHIGDLNMLFEVATKYLTADGELIITTPNPYAPSRVRAGRRGAIWENVDHIMYAFPSGVAELAERHGLLLAEATTCNPPRPPAVGPVRWLKRSIRRSHYHRRGYATTVGGVRPVILDHLDWLDRLTDRFCRLASSRHRFNGETAIYVVTRGRLG